MAHRSSLRLATDAVKKPTADSSKLIALLGRLVLSDFPLFREDSSMRDEGKGPDIGA